MVTFPFVELLPRFLFLSWAGGRGGGCRALARAALGGSSIEEAFYCRLDDGGRESLSHAKFWEVPAGRGFDAVLVC